MSLRASDTQSAHELPTIRNYQWARFPNITGPPDDAARDL